jgi:broad specificity phosphatase PhoE
MNTAAEHEHESTSHREIWLIRHGETEWSRNGNHTGRTDIPLTEHGREQARALVPLLRDVHFDSVFSSPRSRALDTCHLAGLGEHVQIEPDLREWDYGIYEGRTTKEIRESAPDWTVWHSPIPEGESAEQVQARASALIERLLAMPGRTALFSHSHFLRSLAGCWVANSVRFGAHLYLDTASISILGFERDIRAIRQWNLLPASLR